MSHTQFFLLNLGFNDIFLSFHLFITNLFFFFFSGGKIAGHVDLLELTHPKLDSLKKVFEVFK